MSMEACRLAMELRVSLPPCLDSVDESTGGRAGVLRLRRSGPDANDDMMSPPWNMEHTPQDRLFVHPLTA